MTMFVSGAVLGLWLIISPWILGFSGITLAKWDVVIIGLILVLADAWAIILKRKVGEEKNTESIN